MPHWQSLVLPHWQSLVRCAQRFFFHGVEPWRPSARAPLLAGGGGGRGLARLTKLWQGPRAKLPLREPRVNQQNSIKTIGQMSDR